MPGLQIGQGLAPLVFGVTGHRDLLDEDLIQLEQNVQEVFLKFRTECRSTPFVLLSPLAEGADRLVARVALDFGARLIVPLPMPQALYEEDFHTAGSLEEFRALITRADLVFVAPSSYEAPNAEEKEQELPGKISQRERQYQDVGIYIVAHCQILIALWDGVDSGKPGGTAQIVAFQLQGLPPRTDCDLQPPELFPAYHILTPRRSNPGPGDQPYRLKVLYPMLFTTEEAEKYYAKLFHNIDQFNRDIDGLRGSLAAKMDSGKQLLFGPNVPSQLSADELDTLDRYAIADLLAMQYSRSGRRLNLALHLFVFAAFACFVLFAHLEQHPLSALGAALALFFIAYSMNAAAQKRGATYKHEDYRALAEGCRVRLFWQVADVQGSVPDFYLGRQRTELDWIRNVLRSWEIGILSAPHSGWPLPPRLQAALDRWVEGQLSFYLPEKSEKREHTSERVEKLVHLCLGLAIASGLLLFTSLLGAQVEWWEWESEWTEWLVIAIDLFLAGGALLHHARHQAADSEHAKLYRRMHGIFLRGSALVKAKIASGDFKSAQACLRSLGKESLEENGEWVLLHRERALEMPHP